MWRLIITFDMDFTGWINYPSIPGFGHIYLEDSYVLDIIKSKNKICFSMEFVLTEEHPYYSTPKPDEQYCYLKGKIIFLNIINNIINIQNYLKKS